jgi:hypothetical protein
MSTNPRISLPQALDMIHSGVAIQIDDSYVTYPMCPDGQPEDICLLCGSETGMDEDDMDRFRSADNPTVEVTPEGFILIDTRGQSCRIMPLIAMPLGLLAP